MSDQTRVAILLLMPLLAACARMRQGNPSDPQPAYELAVVRSDDDAPMLPGDDGYGIPCADGLGAATEETVCTLFDVSPEEHAAFTAEASRLGTNLSPSCQKLGDAIQTHLVDIRMYDHAIVRYLGPYKFYGVGHSYQADGAWMIRIARRLDELNDRPIKAKLRTLRHEMSHTLGASERRVGDEWSAADYAERCG